jgi:LPXTG-site transpeptidase (sortase) family protein
MPDLIFPNNQPTDTDGQPALTSIYPQADSAAMPSDGGQPDPAVELIRQKIQNLYSEEPAAAEEIVEAVHYTHPGSKHQQFMAQLNASGKSLADIQIAWHQYYMSLPDNEKYEVWQEFYVTNGANPAYQQFTSTAQQPVAVTAEVAIPAAVTEPARKPAPHTHKARVARAKAHVKNAVRPENVADIKKRIVTTAKTVGAAGSNVKLHKKHHLQSLAFGIGCGLVVIFIFLFSFFNEFIIAPFIQPSRHVSDTPVIVDAASTVVSGGPKVLIPKINLEIPVDNSQTTTDEKAIELALDSGVVHYPTTVLPGQAGNAAYFGHSSNNIFNPGKYKFAFVLLHELVEGDVFYLTNDGKTYAYRVFSKQIVEPSEVSVLDPIAGHPATATLITCDPPGTSLHRLVVVGDQISPDASGNTVPTDAPPVETASTNTGLPGNGPTLWSRIFNSIF